MQFVHTPNAIEPPAKKCCVTRGWFLRLPMSTPVPRKVLRRVALGDGFSFLSHSHAHAPRASIYIPHACAVMHDTSKLVLCASIVAIHPSNNLSLR